MPPPHPTKSSRPDAHPSPNDGTFILPPTPLYSSRSSSPRFDLTSSLQRPGGALDMRSLKLTTAESPLGESNRRMQHNRKRRDLRVNSASASSTTEFGSGPLLPPMAPKLLLYAPPSATAGSQSARGPPKSTALPTLPMPESARNYRPTPPPHPPQQTITSFPSQAGMPLPAILASILDPNLSSRAAAPPADHRTGAGYNPRAALAGNLQSYAPRRPRPVQPQQQQRGRARRQKRPGRMTRHQTSAPSHATEEKKLDDTPISTTNQPPPHQTLQLSTPTRRTIPTREPPKKAQSAHRTRDISATRSLDSSGSISSRSLGPSLSSSSLPAFTDADRSAIRQYAHSAECNLWNVPTTADGAFSPPTLTAADCHQILRICGSAPLALSICRNLDLQGRRFTSIRPLLKALQQIMQQRQMIFARVTAAKSGPGVVVPPPTQRSPPHHHSHHHHQHQPYIFFRHMAFIALLDLTAIDRLLRECPYTSPASILRTLDDLESRRRKLDDFNHLIRHVKQIESETEQRRYERRNIANNNHTTSPHDAVHASMLSGVSSPKFPSSSKSPILSGDGDPAAALELSPLDESASTGVNDIDGPIAPTEGAVAVDDSDSASSTVSSQPARRSSAEPDFIFTSESIHIDIPTLEHALCYPTRTIFQKDDTQLLSPLKSELTQLLSQVGPTANGLKWFETTKDGRSTLTPPALTAFDQEKLLRLYLFHLDWKVFRCENVASLTKEVAKLNTQLYQSLVPHLLTEAGWWEEMIRDGLGVEDEPTREERWALHIESTCGPYLQFHIASLVALGQQCPTWSSLIDALRAQHVQFIKQRSEEFGNIRSYLLSSHSHLFWERPAQLTAYQCAELMEFNVGIRTITMRSQQTTNNNNHTSTMNIGNRTPQTQNTARLSEANTNETTQQQQQPVNSSTPVVTPRAMVDAPANGSPITLQKDLSPPVTLESSSPQPPPPSPPSQPPATQDAAVPLPSPSSSSVIVVPPVVSSPLPVLESCLLGSENSASVFMYFQLLQMLGCKFETVVELIAAMRRLFQDQDILWSKRDSTLLQAILPTIGINTWSDAELFHLVYDPMHGGLQTLLHLGLFRASGTHFATIEELHQMCTWSFLHSLEPQKRTTPMINANGGGSGEDDATMTTTPPPADDLDHDTRTKLLHLEYGSAQNLFIYAFLRSPVASHMIETEIKANITLAQIEGIRQMVTETIMDKKEQKSKEEDTNTNGTTITDENENPTESPDSVAPPSSSPVAASSFVSPLRLLRLLYSLEDEIASSAFAPSSTIPSSSAHSEIDDVEPTEFEDELQDEIEPNRFQTFTEFMTGLKQMVETERQEKSDLIQCINSYEANSSSSVDVVDASSSDPPASSVVAGSPSSTGAVTMSDLDRYLDDIPSTVTIETIHAIVRSQHRQGIKVDNLDSLTPTIEKLAASQSSSKSLLFMYLASNTQRLLAKSVVLHDADLSALLAAATSGAAALLILQRMEKELLLAHYTLQAQMSSNRLTAAQKDELAERDAMLGGLSMSQLIRSVSHFVSATSERLNDITHFLTASKLVEGPLGPIDELLTIHADEEGRPTQQWTQVQVQLVWLFSHGFRFQEWTDLKQAMRQGGRNKLVSQDGISASGASPFTLPLDADLMLICHLFGPTCSLLKAGVLFESGELSTLLTAGGGLAHFTFQHLIGLQFESSLTCTSIKQLIEAVEKRQSELITKKQQTWNFLTQKECKLFATTTSTASSSIDVDRLTVTPFNVNRLFSVAQNDGDLLKILVDACAALTPIKGQTILPLSSIAKHAPYRFVSHLIMALRGFYPHHYVLKSNRPNFNGPDGLTRRASIDRRASLTTGDDVDEDAIWSRYPPIARLADGTTTILFDPATEAPLVLDDHELHQLLAASNSNHDALSMHLAMLEIMHRHFYSFHALLHAIQLAQKESKSRIPELREYVASIDGLFHDRTHARLSKSDLDSLYFTSGAGPLCGVLIQEFVESNSYTATSAAGGVSVGRKFGSVKELVSMVKKLQQRFVERREKEMNMLRIIFKGSWDVKQLFGKSTATTSAATTTAAAMLHIDDESSGVRVSDAELSQLLLAGETGLGVLVHMQHAALPGCESMAAIADLHTSISQGILPTVRDAILQFMRSPTSHLWRHALHATNCTHAEVDQLLLESTGRSDTLAHLWALRSESIGFDSLSELADSIKHGRVGCLDPDRAQLSILFAYLHSPSINLLTASSKSDLTVEDVTKLVQLCGGSIEHTLAMVVALDHSNLQYQEIRDLADDMLHMHQTRQGDIQRPQSAFQRNRAQATIRSSGQTDALAAVDQLTASSAAGESLRRDWFDSPIFAFVRDPASRLLSDPTPFSSTDVATLVASCGGSESNTLGLLKHMAATPASPPSSGESIFTDVRSLVAAFLRMMNDSVDDVERFMNRPYNTLLYAPRVISTSDARSLFLLGDAGVSTLALMERLDRTNLHFGPIGLFQFESIEELAQAVRFEYVAQNQPNAVVDAAGLPLTLPPSMMQSPVVRSQRLTPKKMIGQIARFLARTPSKLLSASVHADTAACQLLFDRAGVGRDTLAHIWSLDDVGRHFPSIADLATAIRTRARVLECIYGDMNLSKFDLVTCRPSIEAFLSTIHEVTLADRNWFERTFESERRFIINGRVRQFQTLDEFLQACLAARVLEVGQRFELVEWFHARPALFSPVHAATLTDVDHLIVATGSDAEIANELNKLAVASADLGPFQSWQELEATLTTVQQHKQTNNTSHNNDATLRTRTQQQLSDLAAKRRLQAASVEPDRYLLPSTPSGVGSPAVDSSPSRSHRSPPRTRPSVDVDSMPLSDKRALLLSYLRDPTTRIFVESEAQHHHHHQPQHPLPTITSDELDRMIKIGGGPGGSIKQVITNINTIKHAGHKFHTASDLLFALVHHQHLHIESTRQQSAAPTAVASISHAPPAAPPVHLPRTPTKPNMASGARPGYNANTNRGQKTTRTANNTTR